MNHKYVLLKTGLKSVVQQCCTVVNTKKILKIPHRGGGGRGEGRGGEGEGGEGGRGGGRETVLFRGIPPSLTSRSIQCHHCFEEEKREKKRYFNPLLGGYLPEIPSCSLYSPSLI